MIEISLRNFLILIIFVILFFILIVFFLLKKIKTRKISHRADRDITKEKWREIEFLIKSGEKNNLKIALLKADNLFDDVLKSVGFGGSTLGERLKVASYKYPKLREVWEAHKIRNRLVHESEFELSLSQTKRAIEIFKRALKNLGAI